MVSAALSGRLFAEETITVDATGVGATAQAAEKAALTNAVQQAIGLFLDSETLVKNEQVIYDSILSMSDGFVTKYDVKVPPRQRPMDGLFETTISAVVQKGKVGAELEKHNLIQAVDTKDAWAQAVTAVKSSQDAVEVLERLVPDMVTGLLDARLLAGKGQGTGDVRPEIKPDPTTGHASCAWNLQVSFDRKRYYDKAVPVLQKAFDAIADRRLPDFAVPAPAFVMASHPNYGRTFILGNPARAPKLEAHLLTPGDSRNLFVICLNYAADASRQNLRFHAWAVDRKLYERWLKGLFTPRKLKISFVDEKGEAVVDDELPLSSTLWMSKEAAPPGAQVAGVKQRVLEPPLVFWQVESCWILPDFEVYAPLYLVDSLVMRCELSLEPDDIKKLKSAQLSFVSAQGR